MKALIFASAVAALLAVPAVAQETPKTTTVDRPNYGVTRTISRDPATGTLSRDTQIMRKSDGAIANSSFDLARTANGVTSSRSRTGFDGTTRSSDFQRTRTDAGFNTTGNVVGRNGETYTYNGSRNRGENGVDFNRTLTNGAGEALFNRQGTRARGNGEARSRPTAGGERRGRQGGMRAGGMGRRGRN